MDELLKAIEPFARAAAIVGPLGTGWPDDRPAREIIPGGWPDWGDLKRALAAFEAAGGKL